ncbi:hypothetical protein ES707_05434 [subsurface metagenome]
MNDTVICSKCGELCCVDGEFPKFFAWCDMCNDYASCDMGEYTENWLATKTDEAHEKNRRL